ncbi:MAG: tyrosine phosphatase family protein [Micropepsaceae bacterium]
MPLIYVCPKSKVPEAARELRPSHLITLLDPLDDMPTPEEVSGHRHLRLGMHDVTAPSPDHHAPPDEMHVRELIGFAKGWDRSQPMLIHCWAGISRSTASALTVACMLSEPGREEAIARLLRARAAHAQPNRRLVALADDILGREGRMVDALDAMGPAKVVFEGVLFSLPLDAK